MVVARSNSSRVVFVNTSSRLAATLPTRFKNWSSPTIPDCVRECFATPRRNKTTLFVPPEPTHFHHIHLWRINVRIVHVSLCFNAKQPMILMNSASRNIRKKPRLSRRTDRAWFSRLYHIRPETVWSILSTPQPSWARARSPRENGVLLLLICLHTSVLVHASLLQQLRSQCDFQPRRVIFASDLQVPRTGHDGEWPASHTAEVCCSSTSRVPPIYHAGSQTSSGSRAENSPADWLLALMTSLPRFCLRYVCRFCCRC